MADIIKLPTVQRARKKAGKPEPIPRQWTCRICKEMDGLATSTTIILRESPLIRGVRITGGRKIEVCAYCWQKGRRTEVF